MGNSVPVKAHLWQLLCYGKDLNLKFGRFGLKNLWFLEQITYIFLSLLKVVVCELRESLCC